MKDRKTVEINEHADTSKLAQVLAVIPLQVWLFALVLVALFIGAALWFNHAHFQGFLASALYWGLRVLMVAGVLLTVRIAYGIYRMVHDAYVSSSLSAHEIRAARARAQRLELQNEALRLNLDITRQYPNIIKYAIDAGHNISLSPKGEIQVTSYLSNVHTLSGPDGRAPQIAGPAVQEYIPEPFTLSDTLQNWQPSKDGILLAKKRVLITVPAGEGLCHTVFTGNTDAGKTNNERLLLVQLLFIGCMCFLCDRNYAPLREDRKTGAVYDYRPIAAQLKYPPVTESAEALALLKYLIHELDDRRLQRRKAGEAGYIVRFNDMYLIMDELPAFCQEEPDIMELVGRLVREARQYGIFFIGAAQDLLNATLKNDNGAVRDNLLTCYFGGGDMQTARLILDIPRGETIDTTGLGRQGLFYLRAKGANIERVKARAPLADDQATHILLDGFSPAQQFERIAIPTGHEKRSVAGAVEPAGPAPVAPARQRRATLSDAIEVWNEQGGKIGRPRLQELLQARGLECSDYLAGELLSNIKRRLEERA
jgi:hypothetical protein